MKNIKPAAGQELLLLTPNYWARGKTIAEALKTLRANGGTIKPKTPWIVYSVDKSTTIDDLGMIIRARGTPPPVELARG